ncbi:MAG: hypothetical protein V3R64_07690 [Sphingomonadales bacterium]
MFSANLKFFDSVTKCQEPANSAATARTASVPASEAGAEEGKTILTFSLL